MNRTSGKKLLGILLATIFFVVGMNAAAQDARFTTLTGTVETRQGAQEWQTASAGGLIAREMVVSTGLRSSAVISLGASTLTVGPLTMLTLEELIQRDGVEETALFLRTGRVRADVTPPGGLRAEFTVRSPNATASVRGTSFEFDGRRVHVQSGNVMLASNSSGQRVVLAENQHSQVDPAQPGRLAAPVDADVGTLRPPVLSGAGATGSDVERPRTSVRPGLDIDIGWGGWSPNTN